MSVDIKDKTYEVEVVKKLGSRDMRLFLRIVNGRTFDKHEARTKQLVEDGLIKETRYHSGSSGPPRAGSPS